MTSKPFLCHISREGALSKPFILPQKDPGYYLTDHRNFSRPELLNGRVELNFKKLSGVIFSESVTATSRTKQ